MDSTWTTQLSGRSVEAVERWEALPCVIKLSRGAGSTLKCNVVVVEEYLAWGQIAESLPWPIV